MEYYVWSVVLTTCILEGVCLSDNTDQVPLVVGSAHVSVQIPLVVGGALVSDQPCSSSHAPKPCQIFTCPVGSECMIHCTPTLLKIPVVQCIDSTPSHTPSPGDTTSIAQAQVCVEETIASNILNCRSEQHWRELGSDWCSKLNPLNPARLVSIKVKHACPGSAASGRVKFLSASYTCCPAGIDDLSTAPPPTEAVSVLVKAVEILKGGEDWSTARGGGGAGYFLIDLSLPLSLLLATTLTTSVLLALRWRHKKKCAHQQTLTATTITNPDALLDYDLSSITKLDSSTTTTQQHKAEKCLLELHPPTTHLPHSSSRHTC